MGGSNLQKKRSASPGVGEAKSARAARSGAHVAFHDDVVTVSIPSDQENPSDVWNVYSHVAYTTKKEKRYIQRCFNSRVGEVIDSCSSMFPLLHHSNRGIPASCSARQAKKHDRSIVDALQEQGYGDKIAACATYVLSVWPSLPVKQRPPISPAVELAMEALEAGTSLFIFNEMPNSPHRCDVALRLLHSVDSEEASFAIFSAADHNSIDGYIPLSFIVSLSYGLQPVEAQRHLRRRGKIICNDGDQKVEETSKRAFTLHCAAPEEFYVTFIATKDEDFDNWTRVIDYFASLNTCGRAFMQSQQI